MNGDGVRETLALDEVLVLQQYRELKKRQHGDLLLSVKTGKLVKMWTTEKTDLHALAHEG